MTLTEANLKNNKTDASVSDVLTYHKLVQSL